MMYISITKQISNYLFMHTINIFIHTVCIFLNIQHCWTQPRKKIRTISQPGLLPGCWPEQAIAQTWIGVDYDTMKSHCRPRGGGCPGLAVSSAPQPDLHTFRAGQARILTGRQGTTGAGLAGPGWAAGGLALARPGSQGGVSYLS